MTVPMCRHHASAATGSLTANGKVQASASPSAPALTLWLYKQQLKLMPPPLSTEETQLRGMVTMKSLWFHPELHRWEMLLPIPFSLHNLISDWESCWRMFRCSDLIIVYTEWMYWRVEWLSCFTDTIISHPHCALKQLIYFWPTDDSQILNNTQIFHASPSNTNIVSSTNYARS